MMAKPTKFPAKLRGTLAALPRKRAERAAREIAAIEAVERERLDRLARQEEVAADPGLAAKRSMEAREGLGKILGVVASIPRRRGPFG